jgi:formylglycine-generating enzyme required for sulfatase activity
MADVFISYSKTRRAEAAELAGELIDLGYSAWWDTSLLPTGSFAAAIDRELDAAKAVLVIWSPESVLSKWVRSEARHADRQEKLINTHTAELDDPGVRIPKPFNETHSVGIDEIRAIVAALDALGVPRSGGSGPAAPVVATADTVADADDRLFAEVQKANRAKAYEYYLAELPQGRHVLVARFRLKNLGAPALPAPAPPLPRSKKRRRAKLPGRIMEEGSGQREERYRDEGRIKVDARIVHGAPDGWFLPGNGKVEWFQDYEGGPEMVVVPAGSFMMGSPQSEEGRGNNEGPQRKVTFASPFAVGRFAVTFDQWDACAADGGCNRYRPDDGGWGRGQQPVISVSWNDAKAYVEWLAKKTGRPYRLLSEAEWEYAARAGSTMAFWWGDSISTDQANYDGNHTYPTAERAKGEYRQRTVAVNSFDPNPWGLYQVHGNVWVWTEDCYHDSYREAPADGSGWTSGDCSLRVVRGGSWLSDPRHLRSASRSTTRSRSTTDNRFNDLGFRVGRTLLPP